MRQKLITALSLVLVFSVLFGTQLAAQAHANVPVTSPITFFQITGNVTYKFFKFFSGSNHIDPAPGVTVSAENIFNHHTFQTTTDGNGNYVLPIGENGVYFVKPSGGSASFFAPPLRSVKVKNTGSQNNVNFQGFMF